MQMINSGTIQPVKPLKVFDVSQVQQAFQEFGSASRIGKVAVSLEDPSSELQVRFYLRSNLPKQLMRDSSYPLDIQLRSSKIEATSWSDV